MVRRSYFFVYLINKNKIDMKSFFRTLPVIVLAVIATNAFAQHNQRPLPPEVTVPYLNVDVNDPAVIPALFAKDGVSYNKIGIADWPMKFPYSPEASFGIAYTDNAVLLHFAVNEDDVRAFVDKDNGREYSDSCVEIFMMPSDEDGIYYNFEINCLGFVHLAAGTSRNGREMSSPEVLSGIKRWTTLGNETFGRLTRNSTWEIALVIPLTSFYKHNITSLNGMTFRCNAYKCGGTDEYEHYLSLFPIPTPRPDFHQPDFFKKFYFAGN